MKATMKATARRTTAKGFVHEVEIGGHRVIVDEPRETGGDDEGASPLEMLAVSLAACTAITIEMYAKHKGWDIGHVEVSAEFIPAERGAPTKFKLNMRLPAGLSPEQVERLSVIAAKCPVHRALDGEAMFEEIVELAAPARAA
jgi:putative redox protein